MSRVGRDAAVTARYDAVTGALRAVTAALRAVTVTGGPRYGRVPCEESILAAGGAAEQQVDQRVPWSRSARGWLCWIGLCWSGEPGAPLTSTAE